ncbi:magnesium/cobalt transporter CorA [Methylocella sp. CPCC 101449]|jgi:magnesium transporter|uniref:magnesium/cobalt transporter CorA n=1 Tax=Methylocella sp. CPCC 101449 TaxID=2987531 RepID=UPI002891C016|nr:magnesium/cobalt transporter CorA [Methylocella sp. CPCC 101449]MDT2023621.1 magnesium/cobalt transporter CorA [Methylocella sp. CPCC 101449]HEV2573842.1 magnesium/cobalt transporter CorA [Beijerinckiaceae bacterium]
MLRVYTRDSDHLVAHSINVNATEQQPFPEGTVPWLDLLNPTPEEDRYVEAAVGVSIPTREEMQEIEVSSRLYNENGAEFMTMTAVTRIDTDEPQLTPITFVLKGSTLVTVRYAEPRPFMMFALRVQRANAVSCGTGEQVMLSLMEALIDRIADALEKVGAKIDAISREVFKHEDPRKKSSKTADFQKIIVDIGREGDLVSMARESLLSMNRVLTYHTAVADDSKRALKEIRSRVRSLQRDVTSLTDHSTYLSTKINFLLDATLGLINLEQNQIIKIFSIAAVALMPPTLIASIYGMNFKAMPELAFEYGYPMAIGLMIITAILPFVFFRRRGWL